MYLLICSSQYISCTLRYSRHWCRLGYAGFVGEQHQDKKEDQRHLLYTHKNIVVKSNKDQVSELCFINMLISFGKSERALIVSFIQPYHGTTLPWWCGGHQICYMWIADNTCQSFSGKSSTTFTWKYAGVYIFCQMGWH